MDTGTWGLYYNYTWWGNAIQTAPSVIGKPDFFGSQFLMLTSQQPNQVTNGNFATDSDWSKEEGWTISGGKANANTIGGFVNLTQNNVFVLRKTYKIKFSVTDYTQGEVRLTQAGIDISGVKNSVGTYTATYTSSNVDGRLTMQGLNSFIGSIDNVSVQLVRADNVEAVKCIADWIHETQILDV